VDSLTVTGIGCSKQLDAGQRAQPLLRRWTCNQILAETRSPTPVNK
jgi:hypothetical protein